jgi:hypothetical protein
MTVALAGALIVSALFAYVAWPLFATARSSDSKAVDLASDAEVETMISDYRRARPECPTCGLRPEPGATFCSECGRALSDASALDRLEPPEGDADGDERSG